MSNQEIRRVVDKAIANPDSVNDEDLAVFDVILNDLTKTAKKHHLKERQNDVGRRQEINTYLDKIYKDLD